MPDVARLSIEVTPKGIADAKKQLDQLAASAGVTETKTEGMMDKFRNMQAVMQGPVAAFQTVARVIGSVVAVGSDLVNSFAESEQALARMEAVLKATGGAAGLTSQELQNFAAQMQQTTMFEDDAVISAQAVLLTFKQIGSDVFPAATMAAADMATVMGMDLQSAITMVGKALNEPVEGIGALRRVGVQLTDQQEAMVKALMDVNDVAGAQAIIMGELESQFGGAAEAAAATSTGALAQMKNAFGDVKEAIGGLIADGLAPLSRSLTQVFNQIASDVSLEQLRNKLEAGTETINEGSLKLLTDQAVVLQERIDQINASPFLRLSGVADLARRELSQLNSEISRYNVALQDQLVQQSHMGYQYGGTGGTGGITGTPAATTPATQARATGMSNTEWADKVMADMRSQLADLETKARLTGEIVSLEDKQNIILNARLQLREANVESIAITEAQVTALQAQIDAEKELGDIQVNDNLKAKQANEIRLQGADLDALAAQRANEYAESLQNIAESFAGLGQEAYLSFFESIGKSLIDGSDAGQSFAENMAKMGLSILSQLPLMLLNAGLMAVSSGNVPVGIALIAASGLVAIGSGAAKAGAARAEGVTPASQSSSAGSSAAMGKTEVVVNNYSGAQAVATESTGPNGEKQIMVTIENIVKKSIATGRMDCVMSRFGARPQGVRT